MPIPDSHYDAAIAAEKRGDFATAEREYLAASKVFGARGDSNTRDYYASLAKLCHQDVRLMVDHPDENIRRRQILARNEPSSGCFLGACIDRDDAIRKVSGDNGQFHGDWSDFDKRIGRRHATAFMYLSYGRPAPINWLGQLSRRGMGGQIVMDIKDITQTRDTGYLKTFAADIARTRTPVFLRFAGEMNGDWVPYHRDPAAYKAAFRRVAEIMHANAPNIAMVWCPNWIPQDRIDRYYPGPDSVDWVGVNFYSVYFRDNNIKRPDPERHPASCLDYVYERYSASHPMMIGEWAASQESQVDGRRRNDFCIDKIIQLYTALPSRYPRIKAVHWLSMNALLHAKPGRRLNDYALLGSPDIAAAYRAATDNPWYLDRCKQGARPAVIPQLVAGGDIRMQGPTTLRLDVQTRDQRPVVEWMLAGKVIGTTQAPDIHRITINPQQLSSFHDPLVITVKPKRGKPLVVKATLHRGPVPGGSRA